MPAQSMEQKTKDCEMSSPSPPLASAPAERNGLNAAWPDNPSEADGNSNSASEATQLLRGENAEERPRVAAMAAAMAIGVFLAALDTTIVLTAYGAIGSDLHALNQTSWIATAFFIPLTCCQPLYGKLSDIFGRKPLVQLSYFAFGVGSLFCGLARSITQIILARSVAGIGGGGLLSLAMMVLADHVSPRNRGLCHGILSVAYAAGAAIGIPIGGILSDTIGWRWIFFVQLPIILLGLIGVSLTLPYQSCAHEWQQQIRRIDFAGALAIMLSICALLLGLDRGVHHAWNDAGTVVLLATTPILIAVFLWIEAAIAVEPIAPWHIISTPSILACYFCNFFEFGALMALVFHVPLLFRTVSQLNARQVGLLLLPTTAGSIVGPLTGGLVMRHTGRYYVLLLLALMLCAASIAPIILSTGSPLYSPTVASAGLALGELGLAITVPVTLTAALANARPADQAIVTAGVYSFRYLGNAVGLSITTALVQQTLRERLRERFDPRTVRDLLHAIEQGLESVKKLRPEDAAAVNASYEEAMRVGCLYCLASFLVALGLAALIKERRLADSISAED